VRQEVTITYNGTLVYPEQNTQSSHRCIPLHSSLCICAILHYWL